ncbi:lysosomal amino acid transporter 1 homolog [Chanos chanos]|uniref:Lysosomal amino acid transporter 1 homolog n=1 Tax=Chanos chanos TaxID=29144 RepID=A0A6J2UP84_CHACN|nr:lysosomal amino acid transporter 1 homolog [Chanos chanos]
MAAQFFRGTGTKAARVSRENICGPTIVGHSAQNVKDVAYLGKNSVAGAGNLSVIGRPLCVNGTPWMFYLFQECVENVWEYWSVVISLISMLCFLLSTLPQVYESYRSGKVDEAMSAGFVLFLLGGDFSNFAACYLTKQLPIQIVTAVFYIYTDAILVSQFYYYKIKNSFNKMFDMDENDCNWCFSQAQIATDCTVMTGHVFGYLSTLSFLCSRFPQLYKNYKRQSTEGTSYLLFALAMLGNGTYALSLIVILPALTPAARAPFILNRLAWLIGSFGLLFLDVLVTAQFIMYRKNKSSKTEQQWNFPEVEPLLCEEDEL